MKKVAKVLLVLLILACFWLGVTQLERGRQEQGVRQLEDVLRRGAVACYAAEGFYPPDVAYLCQNYGVEYDEDHYLVHYDRFASNLMPDITVLEK